MCQTKKYYFCVVKRILAILVLMCYSFASMGVSLNYFYCCGKLKSITFSIDPNAGRNCKGTKNRKCCKNEKVTVKLSIDQKHNQADAYDIAPLAILPVEPLTYFFGKNDKQPSSITFPKYNRPPPFLLGKYQTFFCIYRI